MRIRLTAPALHPPEIFEPSTSLPMECLCEKKVEFVDGGNGFYCHKECGLEVKDYMVTEDDNDELLLTKGQPGTKIWKIKVEEEESVPKTEPRPQFWIDLDDGIGPTESTHPGYEDYYTEIRKTYVMGVQLMIELQIKALVEEFKVCPIIVDMIEPVWLRFLNTTNLFSDGWAQSVIDESESQLQGEMNAFGAWKGEPRNFNGKRCLMIWHQSLSNTIPLSYSLAISFLACHLAREPILSTDILKWALEGKLPYFAAFVEINKSLELPTIACPLTSSRMFRPTQAITVQKLESLAACIAQSIGLELPPVNFPAIASLYLKRLSLPVSIILPHACRIYEWSMPPELWLSANEFTPPTHVFILSILVVSVRILYNIHGFGNWEMSLIDKKESKVNDICNSQPEVDDDSTVEPCNKDLDAAEILVLLRSKYNELVDEVDYAKDLEAYLEYCEKMVFASEDQKERKIRKNLSEKNQQKNKKMKELSYLDEKEDKIIKDFLQYYKEKKKDHELLYSCFLSPISPQKRPQDHSQINMNTINEPKDKVTLDPKESHKDREIRRMKSQMEEDKFSYIPPRKRVKRHDYLHYTRKKGGGAYVYAAHADYYILIRSIARVAQVNVRSMHDAVLSFERRLGWLEKNIQHSFKLMPYYEDCEHCELSHPSQSFEV